MSDVQVSSARRIGFTAFVIFGAWRRAVRDAEVEAVGEDEDAEE